MVDSHNCASSSKVAILHIDRLPRQDNFLCGPRRNGTAQTQLEIQKRSLHQRRAFAFNQQTLSRSSPNLQQELKVLVTSLMKQSSAEHSMPEDEKHAGAGTVSTTEISTVDQREDFPAAFQSQHGHMLKARLKPLRPVHIQGPSVAGCQGMLPERIQTNPALDSLTRLQHRWFSGRTPILETSRFKSLASRTGHKVQKSKGLS
ncbi:uncharacterized protein LOC128500806 [Spea bombifrons]|uniref:uncharacterized protein LOC128500806 n=1 Tax=Spea bombifrons TaxID=233779 RepID=UPI00234BBB23|nr:uncharacterized protein LOC128500806 [Spea bombifrons]